MHFVVWTEKPSKIQGNLSKKTIEFWVLLLTILISNITPPGFGDLFWQNVLPTKIAVHVLTKGEWKEARTTQYFKIMFKKQYRT